MPGSVIVAGARTPIGKLSGALGSFSAAQLGAVAIRAALQRAGTAPDEVDYVIMGQVLMAGTGQVPARQAATAAGIPMTTPATNGQQGVPVRAQRYLPGRPDDRGRRRRDHRGRRDGVHDFVPRICCSGPARATGLATPPSTMP